MKPLTVKLTLDSEELQGELKAIQDQIKNLKQHKEALQVFLDKTEWVQTEGHPKYLGMHRADVMRDMIRELREENEKLKALSVTQILINIVPGEDGEGVEIYAKSVEDVEKLLAQLGEKAEDYELVTQPLRLRLALRNEQLAASQLGVKEFRNLLKSVLTGDNDYNGEDIKQALAKTYDDSALRNHVADEILKVAKEYRNLLFYTDIANYAERYRKGEV